MPRQSSVDRQLLIELLCTDMTETERARKLGIARSSYYTQLDKLVQEGVLINRGQLPDDMTCEGSNPRYRFADNHYASVVCVRWTDESGVWGVQGALLDEWETRWARTSSLNDIAIAMMWKPNDNKLGLCNKSAFIVSVRGRAAIRLERETKTRWSSRRTIGNIPAAWLPMPDDTLRRLTIAIARAIDGEAIIVLDGD